MTTNGGSAPKAGLQEAGAGTANSRKDRRGAERVLARHADEQAALYHLADRLHRAGSLREIYDSALDSILAALKCDRASILLFDDSGVMRFVAWRGLSDDYRRVTEGHSPWKPGEENARPLCVNDISAADLPPALKDLIRSEGIHALAFVPLVVNGKVVGKFMTYYDTPHLFSAGELDLAVAIASLLGFSVERERADAALRRSEEQLRFVTDHAPVLLVHCDAEARYKFVNPAYASRFGKSPEEMIGKSIPEVLGAAAYESLRPDVETVLRGERAEFERIIPYEDLGARCMHGVYVPQKNSTGRVEGFVAVIQDITERKRAEEALREGEERYRTLVSQVKDYAIFSMDLEGRPTTWNEGVQRVLGFTEAEFVGKDVAMDIFMPEDYTAGIAAQELREAARTGAANNDRWLRRKDGARFYATGITNSLRGPDGAHIGYTKVLRDDTAMRQAQDALAQAKAELQKHAANLEKTVAERTHDLRTTNEQLEAFVYSIAHDLRAPLRAMSGFSQLLMDDYAPKLDENARHLLQRIQASSEFMDKLLLDLLAYGRSARAEIKLDPMEVRDAWEIAIFQCTPSIEHTHAKVETIEPLPRVLAHEATLGQVLANLLSNALKFVAPGVRPHVRCRAESRGDFARVWVEDNGIGIPPEQHERVFRVFERLHGAGYPGTGIGLSIVRKGVERMGGRVGIESEPGQGTRFWIELKLDPKADGRPPA